MVFNEKALIHPKGSFARDTLVGRLEAVGFTNLSRLELFLWDLEIFLQLQKILKDKIVLKGGAAAQFYFPVENQRTSIDIDIICSAHEVEIKRALEQIEKAFSGSGNLFKARLYTPNQPKTVLPLHTYHMEVPSVCTGKELFGKSPGVQEIKIEFHFSKGPLPIYSIAAPSIFAVKTDLSYQVLPLNDLIGDKLTTLGPNTIGIPVERADELVKQVYDLASLLEFHWEEVDFPSIRKAFLSRAKGEAGQRGLSKSMPEIFFDMVGQMKRISVIDLENDQEMVRLINNFQSLYLRKSLNKMPAQWAITGSKIHFVIDYLSRNKDGKDPLTLLFQWERAVEFGAVTGEDRGKLIKRFKEKFLQKFGSRGLYPPKILKGKNPVRMLWAILTPKNMEEVCSWMEKFFKETSAIGSEFIKGQ